jgi:hypothetical protein
MHPAAYVIALVLVIELFKLKVVSAATSPPGDGKYYSTAGGTSSTCTVSLQTICPAGQWNYNFNNTYAGDCAPCTGLVNGTYYVPNTILNIPLANKCPTAACSDAACSIGQYIAGCTASSPGTCQPCNNAFGTFKVYSGKGSWTGNCALQDCPLSCGNGYYTANCGGLLSATTCLQCTNTNLSVYINTAGGYTADSCGKTDCPSCAIGQYRTGCSGTSSGGCTGCTNTVNV